MAIEPQVTEKPEADNAHGYGFPVFPTAGTQSTEELLTQDTVFDVDSVTSFGTETPNVIADTVVGDDSQESQTVTVEVELSTSRDVDAPTRPPCCPETQRIPKPPCTSLAMSASDIELDDLRSRTKGTQSTDQLVPSPAPDEPTTTVCFEDHCADPKASPQPVVRQTPSFKPHTVRSPFIVLLLVFIAGVLGFLEYQIRRLPPHKSQLIPLNPPGHKRALAKISSRANPRIKPTPGIRSTALPAQTAKQPDNGMRFLIAAPEPTPDPRPPESDYPRPPKPTNTYCGWRNPEWLVYGKIGSQNSYNVVLEQTISTFFTDDESWCPCYFVDGYAWPDEALSYRGWAEPHWNNWMDWEDGDLVMYFLGGVGSNDKDCRSILSAVSSHNGYGRSVVPYFMEDLGNKLTVYDTDEEEDVMILTEHPAEIDPWPWPSTNAEGFILLPFEVQTWAQSGLVPDPSGNHTVTAEEDVFGDAVTSPLWTGYRYVTTNAPLGKASIRWWTLPFSRPSSLISTTEANSGSKNATELESSTFAETTSRGSAPETRIATSTVNSMESGTVINPPPPTSESWLSPTRKISETASSSTIKPPKQSQNQTTFSTPQQSISASSQSPDRTSLGDEKPGAPPIAVQPGFSESTWLGTSSKPDLDLPSLSPPVLSGSSTILRPDIETTIVRGDDGASITTIVTKSHDLHTSRSRSTTSAGATSTVPPTESHMKGELDNSGSEQSEVSVLNLTDSTSSMYQLQTSPSSSLIAAATTVAKPAAPTHVSGPIPPGGAAAFFNLRTEADFLMASVIPVLLTTLLAMAIQVFICGVNSLLPFRFLTHRGSYGARAEDSLLLPRSSGPLAPLASLRLVQRYQDPLPLLTVLLGLLSTILVPISSEVIRLEFSTDCSGSRQPSKPICAFGVRTSGIPMRVAEGFLASMAIAVLLMGFLLLRWKTGVASEPWSIATMASLLSERNLREVICSMHLPIDKTHLPVSEIRSWARKEDKRFRLGFYTPTAGPGREQVDPPCQVYGLYIATTADDKTPIRPTIRDPPNRQPVAVKTTPSLTTSRPWWRINSITMNTIFQAIALISTTGLLILILYYENTVSPDTGFEAFMNSQTFGVRILFTSLGTVLTWFWDYLFFYVSSLTVYHRLGSSNPLHGQPARTSILLSPPMNVFVGLYRSVVPVFHLPSFSIAMACLLAKFTPILFSNIPFRNTVTWTMHEASTWMAVAILSYMVVVLLCSLLWFGRTSRNVYMPVRPDTIMGCLYYLCESNMVKDFEGLGLMNARERDKLVNEMDRRYVFGDMTGEGTGAHRVRVDYARTGQGIRSQATLVAPGQPSSTSNLRHLT